MKFCFPAFRGTFNNFFSLFRFLVPKFFRKFLGINKVNSNCVYLSVAPHTYSRVLYIAVISRETQIKISSEQLKLEENTCSRHQARENEREKVAIGFGYTFD